MVGKGPKEIIFQIIREGGGQNKIVRMLRDLIIAVREIVIFIMNYDY